MMIYGVSQRLFMAIRSTTKGYLFTVTSFIIWGVLPLYWRLLNRAGALEILSHRIFWSFILLFLIFFKRENPFEYLKNPGQRKVTLLTSLFITVNWGTYIFAVNAGYLLEASLGYYINPLVLILLGVLFLKERMNKYQWAAFFLAGTGVVYMTIQYGKIPLVTLILGFSFGFYALLKKKEGLDSGKSLFTEVLYLAPLSLGYLFFKEAGGSGSFIGGSPLMVLLFLLSGLITTFPLFLYAEGVSRIPLVSAGFIQYVGPTLMLFIGVFVFGESFDRTQLISFSCIWAALIIYSLSSFRFGTRILEKTGETR